MRSFIKISELQIDKQTGKNLSFVCGNHYLHKFSLLGSGPIEPGGELQKKIMNHGKKMFKLDQMLYFLKVIPFADFIYKLKYFEYIQKDYKPIDWHIDYKSGFRFGAQKYNTPEKCRQVIGKFKNVDIKVPWELGRLYHLPQLAVSVLYDKKKKYLALSEFKNEVLDFIISNPCGKTVQWSCTMDTGIRCVNLIVAYDLFKQIDSNERVLDDKFEKIFMKSIYEHGEFIINNLEYDGIRSSNHYLANLAGLAFAAAYLPSDEITDAWLVFAVQELIEEVRKQFYEDGTNFEGSTSYHCLSSEIVAVTSALILGVIQTGRRKSFVKYNSYNISRLKKPARQEYNLEEDTFFPRWYWSKLAGMGLFIENITKPDGEIVQVGDNDSGRLLKLSPKGLVERYVDSLKKYKNLPDLEVEEWFDENDNNRGDTLSLIEAFFDSSVNKGDLFQLENSFIKSLTRGRKIKWEFEDSSIIDNGNSEEVETKGQLEIFEYHKKKVFEFEEKENNLTERLKINYWKYFGICVITSKRMYLQITVDTTKNTKIYGHTHNDKSSIELFVDGKNFLLDPGTYLYTSSPKTRDYFRSTRAHNVIAVGNEEQNIFKGPFNLVKRCESTIYFENNKILVFVEYREIKSLRVISIQENALEIDDYCNKDFKVNFNHNSYSNGYGKLVISPINS